jgi:hypothetical protein
MVLLCRRHHGAVHSQRWTLRPSPPPSPPTPPPARPAPPPSPSRSSRSSSTPPPRSGSRDGSGQRFEWFDARRGTTVPAQQRGLTGQAS